MQMASTSVPKNRRNSAASLEPKTPDCFDRLVAEISTLECVHQSLVAHDLSGGRTHLGSVEHVLGAIIGRLYEITEDVETLTKRISTQAAHHV
jgi:hypothetical protein